MTRESSSPLYLMIVGDGMADAPLKELDGRTPLQHGVYPNMARLAGQSGVRMVRTIPEGFPAGTETAMPLITGYGTDVLTGRGPVEAAGMGVVLPPGQFAMRANLVRLDDDGLLREACPELSDSEGLDAGRRLSSDGEIRELLDKAGWKLHPQPGFRQLITGAGTPPAGPPPPHQVSGVKLSDHLPEHGTVAALMRRGRELLRADGLGVWPWGAGVVPNYEPFAVKYGQRGAVISAVPMVRGMASLAGLATPDVPGATGTLRTNWRGKADAVLAAARADYGFVMLHVEAPDDCSHALNLEGKIHSIKRLDEVIGWIIEGLEERDCRIALLPDHVTDTETGKHGSQPVPWCVYDSRMPDGIPALFGERDDIPAEHFSAPLRTLLEI